MPVGIGHLFPAGGEPDDVTNVAAADRTALEEVPSLEHRMIPPDGDNATAEVEKLLLPRRQLPVQPTEFAVLAIGVVVALLSVAQFVTPANHRHPLRQQQRGEEIPLLPFAQFENLGIIRHPFDAAVPTDVMVLAV